MNSENQARSDYGIETPARIIPGTSRKGSPHTCFSRGTYAYRGRNDSCCL